MKDSVLTRSFPPVILKYNQEAETMHTTNLRKVGGSVMLAVPPALLEILGLRPGVQVGIGIENGRLVVEPEAHPRYTLDELLAQCNPKARISREEREWLGMRPVGRELI
jgi:antitoxin ChpS